jgi:hypothetical protein
MTQLCNIDPDARGVSWEEWEYRRRVGTKRPKALPERRLTPETPRKPDAPELIQTLLMGQEDYAD